jgi:hypothetical protein
MKQFKDGEKMWEGPLFNKVARVRVHVGLSCSRWGVV